MITESENLDIMTSKKLRRKVHIKSSPGVRLGQSAKKRERERGEKQISRSAIFPRREIGARSDRFSIVAKRKV